MSQPDHRYEQYLSEDGEPVELSRPKWYEAAIQAGIVELERRGLNPAGMVRTVVESVIDAAIASGELMSAAELDRKTQRLRDDKALWEGEFKQASAELERLRDAIRDHRAYISEENHPGNADKRLWAVLDEEQQ